MTTYAAITGLGKAHAQRRLTNADLGMLVDTSDEWIRARTGVGERYIAGPDESTAQLGATAGRHALAQAGLAPDQIDLVIVATFTPDCPVPTTACTVQHLLGISDAAAFDLNAACSGFVYGLEVAHALIHANAHQRVLLIGADMVTRYVNWNDRTTCVLFGDGAGAIVLEATPKRNGLLASVTGAWGWGKELIKVDPQKPATMTTPDGRLITQAYLHMEGREVFKHAVRGMADVALQACAAACVSLDEIDLIIPHQANSRIIEAAAKRLEVPLSRMFMNVDRYGNTSAATIPIALCEAVSQGRLRAGQHVLLIAFGGGFTWGAAVVRWGMQD